MKANKFYNNIVSEKSKRIPIFAGGVHEKPKKVGYKIIEFTYDVNPSNPDDKMLIGEKEIKRVFFK